MACILAQAAPVFAADLFVINNVTVDITATDAAKARQLAIAKARRAALERLLSRLTLPDDRESLPLSDDAEIADLVRGVDIESEQRSRVRYVAAFTVRFRPEAVRAYLVHYGVPFAEISGKPVLILPVWRTLTNYALWEDPNPWRTVWSKLTPPDGLVPIIIPYGDIRDVSDVSAREAILGIEAPIRKIARRYGAGATLVAIVSITDRKIDPAKSLRVNLLRIGADGVEFNQELLIRSHTKETGEALLARAADVVVDQIERDWKRRTTLRQDSGLHNLFVDAPLENLAAWVDIRRKLNKVSLVEVVDIRRLAKDKARLRIAHRGNETQLRIALKQVDLDLSQPTVALPESGMLVRDLPIEYMLTRSKTQ
ncbi:MAG: DUF2066 domain-containing protein [Pseudomonadota bacterium]|nr:DUF2066 domain-containing protein [Pseudomonadota bacterium]